MKYVLLMILSFLTLSVFSQNVWLNRPSHDGSRLMITDFDQCGESENTPLGEYQVSLGMAYFQSVSGVETWYLLIQSSLVGNELGAYKGDKMLLKCKSGKVIELEGEYDTKTDMVSTLTKAFSISSSWFSFMYRKTENTYYTTQWYKIKEDDIKSICEGLEKVKFETTLNPVLIEGKKDVKQFENNCSYGYRKITNGKSEPKFYDGFRN